MFCRNVFSSVIDALDKDPELKGIKRIVAEVGRSHARRRISKKAFNVMNNITSIVTFIYCEFILYCIKYQLVFIFRNCVMCL